MKRSVERTNSPSPVSYATAEALKRTADYDRSNTIYTIGKNKRRSFLDAAQVMAKKTPGVGAYNSHLAIDKVARPMKKY